MTTQPVDRRQLLLEQAAAWALTHGIAQLSLRPLADALGTSARMLLYHFTSRDLLLHAILDQLAATWPSAISPMEIPGLDPLVVLRIAWHRELRAPDHLTRHAFAAEVHALAIRTGDPALHAFTRKTRHITQASVEALLRTDPRHDTPRATLTAAHLTTALDALLTRAASGDPTADQAFDELLRLVHLS